MTDNQLPDIDLPPLEITSFAYDYEKETTGDFVDIHELNKKIQILRHTLYTVSDKYSEAAARFEYVKTLYDKAYRRAYLSLDDTIKTDVKRNLAAMECEPIEADLVKWSTKTKRYKTEVDTLRADINVAITISHNLRHTTK